MKEIRIKQFDIDEVNEITLLTIEQAERIPKSIRACGEWCWLQSPGDSLEDVAFINYNGDVDEYGYYIYFDGYTVRPTLKINNLKSEIGDKIMVGKTWCTTIDEGLVLTDKPICKHRFDSKSNVWETSELKKFMNSEEFISLL